ncbi:YhjD/YihY/BrkB family envelope integrity protein [Natrinema halophilum]|uniref:YhjD/YihY/BrkB family envelope integrity protein n=1 Tax=Natrinema halophilum TaxID=1699371 RepID=UPI003CCD0AB1
MIRFGLSPSNLTGCHIASQPNDAIGQKAVARLVVFVVLLVATIGIGFTTATLAPTDHPVVLALTPLVLFWGLILAFFPSYYVFPAPDVSAREALPVTVIAVAGWVALEALFGVYADRVTTTGRFSTPSARSSS